MFDWAVIDILTSKSIAMVSFLIYLYLFLKFQMNSSVKMLKIILALFVIGTAAQLTKMYMVPIAKMDSDFDLLTFCTIAVCTLSTSSNVANWLFATTYFSAGHKLKSLLSQRHTTSVYDGSPVTQKPCLDKLCTFWTVTVLFFMDEFLLAAILFYDYKKVLSGDTSIR